MNRSHEALTRVLAASRFVAGLRDKRPEEFEQWLESDRFEQAATAETPPAQADALRRHRNAQLARIAFRDIAGWATVEDTLAALSDLAQQCCQVALADTQAELEKIHGAPSAQPLLLALGKLGGRELNFSSDIDLILCFTQAGETAGPRVVSNEEFFGKLASAFTRRLAERTAEGFVYRVDWMLRPFGSAGPPAMSFAAMEEYYQSHGREWERYALIKARPLAGDLAAGEALLESLRPFVYRRYLDFNAIGHLRDLKQRIEQDALAKGKSDDLKLGVGGIREVEFIVQSFQLMRGGQDERLRDCRLRPVLRHLGATGLLTPQTAQALDEAYVFLRRAENAVQMYEDQQTHALPEGEAARRALCLALDLPDWDTVIGRLNRHRERVRAEFRRIFADAAPGRRQHPLVQRIWAGAEPHADSPLELRLADLRDSPRVRGFNEQASERLQGALSGLIEDAATPEAAERALDVVQVITGRSTYVALLRDNRTARKHLLRLCAASPWLTRLLAQSPALLDALLDEQALYSPPTREELRQDLARAAAAVPAGDTEAAMNLLRRHVQETTLRIAASDLAGALPLVQVSDRLTWLAEAAVEQALRLAQADLRSQAGQACDGSGRPLGLAVIAYGKFGGIELGYGSDLDLVFLHGSETPEAETAGGARPRTHAEYFARWMQRSVSLLSAQTHSGRAYEVDLALRPSGASGPTVSSFAGFADYQMNQAWLWEHQALTRARFVAGDAALGARFEALRREVIARERGSHRLRREILAMRAKMQANLDRGGNGRFDLKQGRGGITDIEFITQFLVLRDAHRAPELARWSDNWRQLEALELAGSVSAAQKDALIRIYRLYRARLHALSLQSREQVVEDSELQPERTQVQTLWRELLENGA